MKKLLLTGIAALFLTTGTAHTETNLAAYGDPQAILPPPEYDYYPPGGFRVFTVPTHSELVRMCGQDHAPFPSCGGEGTKTESASSSRYRDSKCRPWVTTTTT